MRFAVESWAPEYGTAVVVDEPADAEVGVDADVEVPAAEWTPLAARGADAAERVRFVDGVRRVDAWLWVTDGDGAVRAGIAASHAAGSVLCAASSEGPTVARAPGAWLERAEVRRVVVSPAGDLEPIPTRHGIYEPRHADGDGVDALSQGLQQAMGLLENLVAVEADAADLTVVDGLLSKLPALGETIGYVKTHHRRYLPAALDGTVTRLAAGERSPLFRTRTRWPRWSWYLRLHRTGGGHPLAGVVRCELAGEVPLSRAAALADVVTVTLPRFASQPHRDARAPQNLTPIGALERALRHRLGDASLMERALRVAARAP